MAITVEWLFFCESVDYGPDNEVVSIHKIIRPHSGFGVRAFPFACSPRFVFAVRGNPGETATLITTVTEGNIPPELAPPLTITLGASAMAEVVADCGDFTFIQPGTFTFGLRINGEEVFTTKAPLERLI